MDRKTAIEKVNRHVGHKLLKTGNTVLSNVSSGGKDVWWASPYLSKFSRELHVILVKRGDSGLIWLRIAAGSIPAPETVFKVRDTGLKVDIEISCRSKRYQDVRSGGTGYEFARHIAYEWG